MKFKNEKKEKAAKLLKTIVNQSLIIDSDYITCLFVYQPKAPKELKKFSKIKKNDY